jgi:CBS domain-containing protein
MKLKDIMTEDVEVISPDASIYEAARMMRLLDIGALPVCSGDRLVGMLTDRDLTIRSIAEGRDPKTTSVKETMTPQIVWCFDDQNVEEAENLMQEQQVRRLPVLDREKHLVGIVSLGDLATRAHDAGVVSTLEEVSMPAIDS